MLAVLAVSALAQPLEDVSLRYGEKGVVATIALTSPVQYLRHFPEKRARFLEIFYDRAPGASLDEKWLDNEVRSSPPSSLIPGFTVTTRDQQTKPKLVIEFSREADYVVEPGKDGHSIVLTIRPDKAQISAKSALPLLPLIGPVAVPAADADPALLEIAQQARTLMIKGRDALSSKNNEEAVGAFNQLLLLPPNDYSRDAQEWVGVARERSGQIDKAKIEYELYLTLYPTGEGTGWVKQRLDNLSGQASGEKVKMGDVDSKKQAAQYIAFGGITSRYYWGSSTVDTSYVFNNVLTNTSYSDTDQSALITNVDASARYLTDEYDNRIVFRDVVTKDFLYQPSNSNRVNTAYAEIKDRTLDYSIRVGRQSPNQVGVMGRFDGISGGYGILDGVRINAAAGTLADNTTDNQPSFVATSLDMGPYTGYFVSQKLEGYPDRRAVGAEYRYFEQGRTAYALVDYDIYFAELNTAMLMGTLDIGSGTTLNILADHRRSPTLSIRNALNGAGVSTVAALRQTMTAQSLRDLALARTATADFTQVGATHKLSEKWQLGVDLKLSSISGLSASGTTAQEGILTATDGTGTESTVTVQAIGNNLFRKHDLLSSNVSVMSGKSRDAYSLYLFYQMQLTEKWTLDSSWMMYTQDDPVNGKLTRNSPMVRTSYRITDRFSADADLGVDLTDTSGPTSSNTATRTYFSTGVRWEF